MSPIEWEQADSSNAGEQDELDEDQGVKTKEVADKAHDKRSAVLATFTEAHDHGQKNKQQQAEELGRPLTEVEKQQAEREANQQLIQQKTDEIEQATVLSLLAVDADSGEQERQRKRLQQVFERPEKTERFMELWLDAQAMPDGPVRREILKTLDAEFLDKLREEFTDAEVRKILATFTAKRSVYLEITAIREYDAALALDDKRKLHELIRRGASPKDIDRFLRKLAEKDKSGKLKALRQKREKAQGNVKRIGQVLRHTSAKNLAVDLYPQLASAPLQPAGKAILSKAIQAGGKAGVKQMLRSPQGIRYDAKNDIVHGYIQAATVELHGDGSMYIDDVRVDRLDADSFDDVRVFQIAKCIHAQTLRYDHDVADAIVETLVGEDPDDSHFMKQEQADWATEHLDLIFVNENEAEGLMQLGILTSSRHPSVTRLEQFQLALKVYESRSDLLTWHDLVALAEYWDEHDSAKSHPFPRLEDLRK